MTTRLLQAGGFFMSKNEKTLDIFQEYDTMYLLERLWAVSLSAEC